MYDGAVFTILDTVGSTNNYAMAKVHEGLARHGMAWFSKEQTAGKGQRGKTWLTEKGKNIAMSVVLEPGKLKLRHQFHLSALVALTCLEFFTAHAGAETTIKWPNDLFWRDRKAGGVLIENTFKGKNWNWAVVGIGININQTQFENLPNKPVALKQITGQNFDVIELAKALHLLLLTKLDAAVRFEEILEQYNNHLFLKNNTVTLKKEGAKFETVIKEVSGTGQLITVDAIEHAFSFGEVEWVI